MFCQKCNAGPFNDCNFCEQCGSPLHATEAVTPPSDVPAQTAETPDPHPAQSAFPQQQGYPSSPQAPAQTDITQSVETPPQAYAQPAYPQQQGYPPSPQPHTQSDPTQAAYNPYGQYPPPPPPVAPKKNIWKIIVSIAGALVLLIGAAVTFFLMMRSSPVAIAARALENAGTEFSERIEDTPLELFGMLFEALTDGSTTVGFEYSDGWSEYSGHITLHADENHVEYLIETEIALLAPLINLELNVDLYVTEEVFAARISQFDDNFYGFYLGTFEDDLRSFLAQLGLDRQEVEYLMDEVGSALDFINMPDETDELVAEFEELFSTILDRMEVSLENVDFTSGDSSIRARRIDFAFSYSLMFDILDEFLDILEESDYFRASFYSQESLFELMDIPMTTFDATIRQLRRALNDAQRSIGHGDFVVSMYIDRNDRLLRIELNADFEVEREHVQFTFAIDFGTSAHDTWVIEIMVDDFSDTTYSLEWEVNETSRGGETIIRAIEDSSRWGTSTNELILDWTNRGDFALSVEDERQGRETILTGTYTSDGEGFNLVIDDPFVNDRWRDDSLHLEISTARRDGRIEPVDFINLSEWDMSLIDMIEDFVTSFNPFDMGGFPGTDEIFVPTEPTPTPTPPTGVTPDLAGSELIGFWEFSHGRPTYFFWQSEFVFFSDTGFVMADDSFADWSVDGNTLTVVDAFTDLHEVFTFEIDGNILAITDSDGDTGYFEFLFD